MTVQRAAWVAMACVIAAALAGLTGRGAASTRERATPDRALVVRFDRIVRVSAPTRLELAFDVDEGQAVVWLSNSYLEHVELERVTPRPDAEVTQTGHVALHVRASGRARLELTLKPRRAGSVSGEIALGKDLERARIVRVEHLVLP